VPINFRQKLTRCSEHWAPRVVAELNDYQFKLVQVNGEFVWHDHSDIDEAFIVRDGRLSIAFEDGALELSAGELFVVPKGVRHKPYCDEECHLLLVKPRGVVNTGESAGQLNSPNDVWV
jgi:mannose-6-phosphate isomerase-like protein (cupin superfamily)